MNNLYLNASDSWLQQLMMVQMSTVHHQAFKVHEENRDEKNRENEVRGSDFQVVKITLFPLKSIDL